jgi:HSP20 family protein
MANNVQSWSPFRELDSFRRSLDRMFDDYLGGWNPVESLRSSSPPLESYVDGDNLVVRVDLPGIDPKDVEVSVTDNMLTVTGKREQTHEEKKRDYLHREVSYGAFTRSIALPKGIDAEQVKANYRNGVLELTMPTPRELAPRKVPIAVESKHESANGNSERSTSAPKNKEK